MTLRINLLGPVQIYKDDQPISLPGYRPLALLSYLLITGQEHSRERLVNLLFDRPDDPRAALRWTLAQLRKSIGFEAVIADRQKVAFNFGSDYWLDISAFEAGDLDLYRGDLLEGLYLRDAHQYDAWLLVQRERLRARYQEGLEKRLEDQIQKGEDVAVEKTAVQLLELDNMRESWHRALMSAYAQQGKFEAARAQFELCRQILNNELGIEPAPETAALARSIRQQQAGLMHAASARSLGSQPELKKAEQPGTPSEPQPPADEQAIHEKKKRSWPLNRKIILSLTGLFLLLLVAGLSFIEFQGTSGAQPDNLRPFAGSTVSIIGIFDEDQKELFARSLMPFEQRTGIDVQIGGYQDDLQIILPSLIESGVTPDIVSFPQPGFLADFVRSGEIVDVSSFLDDAYLQKQYGAALLESMIIEDVMAGVWVGNNVKSLVWYPKKEFDEAGYKVPQTWDELTALSDQIAADGHTPWCIGIESGVATGWVGTDWVEDILLRTAPLETYDAWVQGELPFDSPEIRRVFDIMGDIWLNEPYVFHGREGILTDDFVTANERLFANPPDCFLTKQASFIISFFEPDVTFGEDYDFFYLPPIDSEYGRPMLIGGDIMAMLNDRPEVREVMRHLTTAESVRYLVQEGFLISAHRDAPFEWYSDPANLKIAQIFFAADAYRFDGSDLMPGGVGTDSFWRGIVSWVEGEDLDSVLREIDASWPSTKIIDD